MDNSLHPSTTKTLLIVYHSVTGGTRQMVEAAARGAALEPAVRIRLLPAPLAEMQALLMHRPKATIALAPGWCCNIKEFYLPLLQVPDQACLLT